MDSVVHFEITYENKERVQQFYTKVFDWQLSQMPEFDYLFANSVEVDEQGKFAHAGAINGGMFKKEPPFTGPVLVMDVKSIDKTQKKIENHGGEIIVPKQPVGDMGYTAYFKDSEGNILGLWESNTANA